MEVLLCQKATSFHPRLANQHPPGALARNKCQIQVHTLSVFRKCVHLSGEIQEAFKNGIIVTLQSQSKQFPQKNNDSAARAQPTEAEPREEKKTKKNPQRQRQDATETAIGVVPRRPRPCARRLLLRSPAVRLGAFYGCFFGEQRTAARGL